MSIAVMTEVWKDAPVAGTELLMLLALADSCNDDRECWPSVRHLQHKARVSEAQARKLLRNLKLQGVIEVVTNGGKGTKGRQSNLYRILPLTPIAQDTPQASTPIARDTTTPITQDTLNHHSEPSKKKTMSSDDDAGDQNEVKKERVYPPNPIFDAVLLGSWGLKKIKGNPTVAAMVGKIVSALKANDEGVTAERIAEFYEWYSDENSTASAPRDAGKFMSWWLKFEAQDDDEYGGSDPFARTFENII